MIGVGLVYLYCMFYQQVDEEEYGGVWELIKEGFMTSSAIFLVSQQSYTILLMLFLLTGFMDSNIHSHLSQLAFIQH